MLLANRSLLLRLLGGQQKSTADQCRGQHTAQQDRLLTSCCMSPADRSRARQHGSLG